VTAPATTAAPPPERQAQPLDDDGGAPAAKTGSYASGARILSIGIASTGIFTSVVNLPNPHGQPVASDRQPRR